MMEKLKIFLIIMTDFPLDVFFQKLGDKNLVLKTRRKKRPGGSPPTSDRSPPFFLRRFSAGALSECYARPIGRSIKIFPHFYDSFVILTKWFCQNVTCITDLSVQADPSMLPCITKVDGSDD